jgi:hypothetical protein
MTTRPTKPTDIEDYQRTLRDEIDRRMRADLQGLPFERLLRELQPESEDQAVSELQAQLREDAAEAFDTHANAEELEKLWKAGCVGDAAKAADITRGVLEINRRLARGAELVVSGRYSVIANRARIPEDDAEWLATGYDLLSGCLDQIRRNLSDAGVILGRPPADAPRQKAERELTLEEMLS